jgi:hypothetical protein
VYAKTIVSSAGELPFVLMNISELNELVDEFLVCESNITHTGESRNFSFLDAFESDLEKISDKIRPVRMNLEPYTSPWNDASEILHRNEQEIRNGFTRYVKLKDDDIVISMDADEIIHTVRAKKFIKLLNRKVLPRTSYVLRLHVIIYKISYNWVNCKFQAPVICKAIHFMHQDSPQWRYSGARTILKSGTHFTWLMTPSDMVKKILKYSHRKENEQFANPEFLRKAIESKQYPFEPDRPFQILERNLNSRVYPKSLSKYITMFKSELV